MKEIKDIANFLYEVGILSKTPRSGFYFIGTGEQSVAEHINRVVFIGYALASLEKDIDMLKVLKMCLLHDLAESRVSDLNYVHQKYVKKEEERAVEDLVKTLSFGEDMHETIKEYEERKTKEAILAKDADNIEWIISLKEQADIGNTRAKDTMLNAVKRIRTENAKKIVQEILKTGSDEWWFGDREDEWWVNRGKKD